MDAIKLFKALEKKYPNRIEPKIWLARAYKWMTQICFNKKKEGLGYAYAGVEWARKAIAIEPNNPSANFLDGLNLSWYAGNKSFFSVIRVSFRSNTIPS